MTNRFIPRIRSPRKERNWGITNSNQNLAAATAAGMVQFDLQGLIRTDLGFQMPGVTASAIRLNVSYLQIGAQSTDEDIVACGIAFVSDTAVASGGADLPDPSIDHYDWMFHDIRMLSATPLTDLDSIARNGFFQIKNDSMRKQCENHSSLMMVFRATQLQSTSIQIFVGGRVLFLLP